MDTLCIAFSNLSLDDKINKIIKIQKVIRGFLVRIKLLPLIMYRIKSFLLEYNIQFSNITTDGRINSCIDEDNIIRLLQTKFINKIKKPIIRSWFDILAFDTLYGWIPINIKTTKMTSNDNVGNLALCVYSYTNINLQLNLNTTYNNGIMSKILIQCLENKDYNIQPKKDYFFLVLNKTDSTDIIINSIKGLSVLTPNINNLPFQICWNDNRNFYYKNIKFNVQMLIDAVKKPKPIWSEEFCAKIRKL